MIDDRRLMISRPIAFASARSTINNQKSTILGRAGLPKSSIGSGSGTRPLSSPALGQVARPAWQDVAERPNNRPAELESPPRPESSRKGSLPRKQGHSRQVGAIFRLCRLLRVAWTTPGGVW